MDGLPVCSWCSMLSFRWLPLPGSVQAMEPMPGYPLKLITTYRVPAYDVTVMRILSPFYVALGTVVSFLNTLCTLLESRYNPWTPLSTFRRFPGLWPAMSRPLPLHLRVRSFPSSPWLLARGRAEAPLPPACCVAMWFACYVLPAMVWLLWSFPCVQNGTKVLDLNTPDPMWTAFLGQMDYIVFGGMHWFFHVRSRPWDPSLPTAMMLQ